MISRELRAARVSIGVVFFLHGLVAGSWASRIPSIKEALGLSVGSLGVALLAPALGALVAMSVSGALVARRGSRAVTTAGIVGYTLTLAGPALAADLSGLVAALLLLGALGGATDVAMNAQAVEVERRYERQILSAFHGGWSVGAFTGAALGGIALRLGLSTATHLWGAALIGAAVGAVAVRSLIVERPSATERPRLLAVPKGPLATLGAICFAAMLAEGSALDWGAVYMREEVGTTRSVAVLGLVAFSVAMASGRLVGDGLIARLGAVTFARAAGLLGAAGFALTLALPWASTAVVGFALVGAGISCIVPLVFGAAPRVSGTDAGPAIAGVATAGYVAFLAGPALLGGVAELLTLRWALGAVLALLGLVPMLAGGLWMHGTEPMQQGEASRSRQARLR